MADEQATTYTELAVALGRVEEGIKGMKESLDRMEKRSEDHATALLRLPLSASHFSTVCTSPNERHPHVL